MIHGEQRPVRLLESTEDDEGHVRVLRPKFGTHRFGRWLSRRIADPYLKIRLDDIGSFVWKRCDGVRTVAEIAAALEAHTDNPSGDLGDRFAVFLDRMVRRGLIRLE